LSAHNRRAIHRIATRGKFPEGFSYYRQRNFKKVEELWLSAAKKGSKEGARHLLFGLFTVPETGMVDISKFRDTLYYLSDKDGLNDGWGKTMLGSIMCGSPRAGWINDFDISDYEGSFYRFEGIDLDPAKGICLIRKGLEIVESGNSFELDWQDYSAIACAYRNRFRYVHRGLGKRDSAYSPDDVALDDLKRFIEYEKMSQEMVPENHPHRDEIIELSNDVISSVQEEIKNRQLEASHKN
jgi:hypothetical protein